MGISRVPFEGIKKAIENAHYTVSKREKKKGNSYLASLRNKSKRDLRSTPRSFCAITVNREMRKKPNLHCITPRLVDWSYAKLAEPPFPQFKKHPITDCVYLNLVYYLYQSSFLPIRRETCRRETTVTKQFLMK